MTSMVYLCGACGTSYAGDHPARCRICNDERQFVPPSGQVWTTPDAVRHRHANSWRQFAPGLLAIHTEPRFAIGQRAFLVSTPDGNIMWDCIANLDPATERLVASLGGLSAIAISHPHYYTSMQDWAAAFDAPVHLHAADREWVTRDSPALRFWEGDTLTLATNVELVRLGGHFAGGTVLHQSEGSGTLLVGDIIQVTPGADRVSFMWSYPNMLPLHIDKVRHIASSIAPYAFERLHGAFLGQDIARGASRIVAASAEAYVCCLTADRP